MTSTSSPRILVVDDSDDDFILIRRQIRGHWPDAQTMHAADHESLMLAINELNPELVICDYNMPGLTHEDVHRALQGRAIEIPVILMSGALPESKGVTAMQEGMRDYIEKARSDRLIPAIEREFNTLRLQKEKAELLQAQHKAFYFDSSTGFLNRQGLTNALNKLLNPASPRKDLCLLGISLSARTRAFANLDERAKANLQAHLYVRMKRVFEGSVLCKWSDEVFAILIEGFNWTEGEQTSTIARLAEYELELIHPIALDHYIVSPELRIGLARPGLDGTDAQELVSHAQTVAGVISTLPGRIQEATRQAVHDLAKRRLTIARGLGRGIEQNELRLEFQPVECLHKNRVIGLEALVRWTHPELGLIMPDEFIGVAEDSGLISDLGKWVAGKACETVSTMHAQGHDLWCAINCSTLQLLNPDFVAQMQARLDQDGISPEWLEFEITETAAIENMEMTVSAIEKLRSRGTKVALDDFGTGYSSLSYLRKLPLDVVKIDKSFIKDLLEDSHSRMIVKAVIDLAHALGLDVHAEGIETNQQREILIELGCDRLQGYLFGKPMQIEALNQWLAEHESARAGPCAGPSGRSPA